jgi:uncharacterized repeat protein (TIGR03803 family)
MTKLNGWKTNCFLLMVFAATAIAAHGQSFNTLLEFDGANGARPLYMSPVQGLDGNLYGTTANGGGSGCGQSQSTCGTIFRITPEGKLRSLHLTPVSGFEPLASLTLATNGNFYGTDYEGGPSNAGTVFEITPAGKVTTLYSFCAKPNCVDGTGPSGSLIQAANGDFYGTTNSGGAYCSSADRGCGTIFKISSEGELTTVYSFCGNCGDGSTPVAGLVQGTDGNFYGTTTGLGTFDSEGTVFKITPAGRLTTLYIFGGADGAEPWGWLVQGADGNFYGTTLIGGIANGGTVFKITPDGTLTTLYRFCTQSSCTDGSGPYAGLVQATDGNFYGTTYQGGASNEGTAFEITPAGTLTTLHSFDGVDGYAPSGGLIQATSGAFYGVTSLGGDFTCKRGYGCGVVFSLSTGLGPFVAFVRAAGEVGQIAEILGQGLTGTSGVSLNGIPASFTVVSDTFIKAAVPAGATTGYVTVTTPSGTLISNVPFHVIP